MVFNDFVPNGGGGSVNVKTDGGFLEAGLGGDPTGAGPDPVAQGGGADDAPGAGMKLKVTEPGAEPRAPRKYAFKAGQVDHRVMTSKQSVTRPGQPGQDLPTIAFTADFTPKAPGPKGTKFDMKLLKVDAPDAPPQARAQAAQQLGVFAGLTGGFDVSPHGEIGELDFKADEKMQRAGADAILQALQSSLQAAVAELPSDPIGVGAKWEGQQDRAEGGISASIKKSYTLTDASADGATIEQLFEISIPKHPFQQRGVPPGTTEDTKGVGKATIQVKWDHLATKVTSELKLTQTIEVPAGGGQPKQSMAEVATLKSTFDVAK